MVDHIAAANIDKGPVLKRVAAYEVNKYYWNYAVKIQNTMGKVCTEKKNMLKTIGQPDNQYCFENSDREIKISSRKYSLIMLKFYDIGVEENNIFADQDGMSALIERNLN